MLGCVWDPEGAKGLRPGPQQCQGTKNHTRLCDKAPVGPTLWVTLVGPWGP